MTPEDFIKVVKVQTSDSAVRATIETLKSPQGENQPSSLLSDRMVQPSVRIRSRAGRQRNDKRSPIRCIRLLLPLDGVPAFEDGQKKGDLQLIYTKCIESILLNASEGEFLQDLYISECDRQAAQASSN